jgi:membrane protease YdiL (CAAX protease family)
MHILSAGGPVDTFSALWPSLILAIGTATAVATHIFRRGSIVGPVRLEEKDNLEPLAVAMGAGLMVYFTGPALAVTLSNHPLASQPLDQIPTPVAVLVDLMARIVAVVVIVVLLQLWYRQPQRLGLTPEWIPKGVATGLLSLFMVLPLMWLVLMVTSQMVNQDTEHVHPYLKLLGESQGSGGKALILLSILVGAPVSEELFFRGCVQTLLSGWLSKRATNWRPARVRWLAVVFTSLLFASAHSDWWSRPPIFVLSLCLGYAYERTGNLWTSITIHAAFNASQAALFQWGQ